MHFRNFPVLSTATSNGGLTHIVGTLSSLVNTTFRIEFFANDSEPLGLPRKASNSSALQTRRQTPAARRRLTYLSLFR
jgi:hypothetical protein